MTDMRVLITGASAGIGAEFARQYAGMGWNLILTARRADRLEALKTELEAAHKIDVQIIACDLAKSGAADLVLMAVDTAGNRIDALVNNAGYGLTGTFFNTRWEDQADFLNVLYTVPCELTHKVLPGMKSRGFGRIINVASLAGYTPGSVGHTLYASVKSGLIKFSESINAEAAALDLDIHCTALCPGFTWSEFHDVNGTRDATSEMPKWMWMDAAPVVKAGISAVEQGKPVIVPGGVNKFLAFLTRKLPEPVVRKMVRAQSKQFRNTEA